MKKLAVFALAATIAATGLAGDTKPAAPSKTTEAKVPENESPLVRAARLSSRKGKKPSNVITNKTLKERGSKAHITTSTVLRPLPAFRVTPPAQAKVIVAPKSEATTEEKKKLADAIEAIDDPNSEIEDPAMAERMAAEAASATAESASKSAPPAEKPPERW